MNTTDFWIFIQHARDITLTIGGVWLICGLAHDKYRWAKQDRQRCRDQKKK